jgi:hypothetical protein
MPFISQPYHALLTRHGLCTPDDFWNLPWDWVETPNRRRNGWSGASRYTFVDTEMGHVSIFVKRQENHTYWSLRHPFRGRPTFFRDFCNIWRLERIGVPTVEPVFYGERRGSGSKRQAVLATIALEGYSPLSRLFHNSSLAAPARQEILHRLADTLQLMHRHHWQHNSLSSNHVMVKWEEDHKVDLRILDLEKMRRTFRPIDAAARDLEKFIRSTPTLTMDEHAAFLFYYTRHFTYTQRRKLVEKIIQRLLRKSLTKRQVVPLIV